SAFIGENAWINTDQAAANADQSVNISAFNDAQVFSFAGGIGVGFVGVGGGVDVGVLRNNTSAYIGAGTEVHARRDVDVNAMSLKDVESVAASAAGGVVAGVGSVSVWAIGTKFDASYSDGDTSANSLETADQNDGNAEAPQFPDVQSFADAMAGGSDPQNPGGQENNGYTAILDGHAHTVFDPALAVDDVQGTINLGPDHGFTTGDAAVYRSGGGNSIGGLVDGETYYVIATSDPDRVQLASSRNDALEGGALDLDASVASGASHKLNSPVGNVTESAGSDIDDSAPSGAVTDATASTVVPAGTTAFIAQNALVSAGDDIAIRALEDIDFGVVAGSAAVGAAGIGGSVAVANLRSNTDAHIGMGAIVSAGPDLGDDILVSAQLDETANGFAFAGQLGAVTLG
ncbi:MAG TPA: hypothetical protein VLB27_03190, partial [candidate division Zixibacteria bacterium]|nr:hypothetical protein [candidate division Zixibacteria bacterium]